MLDVSCHSGRCLFRTALVNDRYLKRLEKPLPYEIKVFINTGKDTRRPKYARGVPLFVEGENGYALQNCVVGCDSRCLNEPLIRNASIPQGAIRNIMCPTRRKYDWWVKSVRFKNCPHRDGSAVSVSGVRRLLPSTPFR